MVEDDEFEVVCNECEWYGDADNVIFGRCPECGSRNIVYVEELDGDETSI